jgi:squalene synthase HpnC
MMTDAAQLRSGKGHKDENFPVASHLIAKRHRPLILAFYEFVRTADDVADNAKLTERQKIDLLDGLEANLVGSGAGNVQAVALREALADRGLSPVHAQDLLKAFRLDATKRRYKDWDDLISYCAYSAMPVGRFVLDVHGESRATWPASDAICAALQINNHLQDCANDYRDLDRVYVPIDELAKYGLTVEALGAPQASLELRRCFADLARRTKVLLQEGEALPRMMKDFRLSLELQVIYDLAINIADLLAVRDPLSENVKLGKRTMASISLMAVLSGIRKRIGGSGSRHIPAVGA